MLAANPIRGACLSEIMARTETVASKNRSKIMFVLLLTSVYLVVEVAGSIFTHSLALLADATHMFIDLTAVSMTLIAINFSTKKPNTKKTYGYLRAEVMVAFINALILLAAAAYIFYQAYQRFVSPPAEIYALPMLAIAFVGLLVNIASMKVMGGMSKKSINAKGLYLEAMMDGLSSAGVVVTGAIILFTNLYVADAVFSVIVGIMIIPRVFELLGESSHILMEGTPSGMDVNGISRELRRISGVRYVHDLHVWCLTSGVCSASVHLVVRKGCNNDKTLNCVCGLLKDKFDIQHATVQFEVGRMKDEFTH